jgi:hypothetical protein
VNSGALGQVSVMREAIFPAIPGAEDLANWFGGWPSFHDAEIIDLHLQRAGRSRIRIHTWQMTNEVGPDGCYVTDHHVEVTFWFEDISGLALTGFNLQNVIAGLDVEKTASGYRISLEPCYGLAGDIEAGIIRISFEPGSPRELSAG